MVFKSKLIHCLAKKKSSHALMVGLSSGLSIASAMSKATPAPEQND